MATSNRPAPSSQQRRLVEPIVTESLDFLGVHVGPGKYRLNSLPQNIDPQGIVKYAFFPNKFLARQIEPYLQKLLLRPRSIECLQKYYDRRVKEALWMDVVASSCTVPYVRDTAKHKLKKSIHGVLRQNDIHHDGWSLSAYNAASGDKPDVVKKNPLLDENPGWLLDVPMRLQGTLRVMITDCHKFMATDRGVFSRWAGFIAGRAMTAQAASPPSKLPLLPNKAAPWLRPTKMTDSSQRFTGSLSSQGALDLLEE